MRTTIVLAVLSALVGAQSPADFPPCSDDCLDYAMSKVGCATGAVECGCTNYQDINDYITTCLKEQCTPAEDMEFRNLVVDVCEHAGVPIQGPDSQELYTMELHNLSDDDDNIITAYTLVTEVASPIEEPTGTPSNFPQPEFTGVPSGFPDPSLPPTSYSTTIPNDFSTESPCYPSTATLESTVDVSSEVVPYPTPIPIYTTTIAVNSTLSTSSSLPTFTGAAVMGARGEGAIVAGLVGLLGLVI